MSDLDEGADSLLSKTTVAFDAVAQTTLYTVPLGKCCVITKAVIVVGADAVTTDITIGVTGTWDNWAGTNGIAGADIQLDNLDAAGAVGIISPATFLATPAAANTLQRYTAGEIIKIDVVVATGGATNVVYLFGFLYDA